MCQCFGMDTIAELAKGLWDVWGEMYEAFMDLFPKVLVFTLWIICGIIILPCVYVSGVLYPLWTEWGDKM